MNVREYRVYAKDRKTVLATVSSRYQSIGAAKAAKVSACKFSFVNNKPAWVAK